MTSSDMQLLFQVMSAQSTTGHQKEITAYLTAKVLEYGATTITNDTRGNLYVTKGDSGTPYPTVVAHMDTVHKIVPPDQFAILSHNGTWFGYNPVKRKTTGIGGDDKVGIYIALRALQTFDHIKLAFFVDEEIGCQGSRAANMAFFDDSAYVIQCDRKGYGDIVNEIYGTPLFGREFLEAITPLATAYGMKPCEGGMTDVQELKERGLAVAATNVSCGYYLPHTADEFLILKDVFDTTDFVLDLIEELGTTQYLHTAPAPVYEDWYNISDRDWDPLWYQHYQTKPYALPATTTKTARNIVVANDNSDWFCYDCVNYTDNCTCDIDAIPDIFLT